MRLQYDLWLGYADLMEAGPGCLTKPTCITSNRCQLFDNYRMILDSQSSDTFCAYFCWRTDCPVLDRVQTRMWFRVLQLFFYKKSHITKKKVKVIFSKINSYIKLFKIKFSVSQWRDLTGNNFFL
jgi:hypothetical protein